MIKITLKFPEGITATADGGEWCCDHRRILKSCRSAMKPELFLAGPPFRIACNALRLADRFHAKLSIEYSPAAVEKPDITPAAGTHNRNPSQP